jgi:hypothetical protein
MTFAEQLKNHVGGLVRLQTDLYWYRTTDWDGVKGRVCLLLDAAPVSCNPVWAADVEEAASAYVYVRGADIAYMLLLIDGSPKWILNSKEVVELVR